MDETHHESVFPTTVLRDTREQHPWTFDGCAVETRDATLSTGDYAIPADCTHDPESDTYHPQFAVERKSGHDFLTSLTWERDRFTSELRRAAKWPRPIAVVVETSWQTLLRNRGCMAWRDIHPSQVVGTLSTWIRHYNVVFHFVESRQRAERCALLLFVHHSLIQQRE